MKKYLIVFIFLFQLLWIFAADDNKNLEFQLYGMNIFANQNFDTLPAQTAAGKAQGPDPGKPGQRHRPDR